MIFIALFSSAGVTCLVEQLGLCCLHSHTLGSVYLQRACALIGFLQHEAFMGKASLHWEACGFPALSVPVWGILFISRYRVRNLIGLHTRSMFSIPLLQNKTDILLPSVLMPLYCSVSIEVRFLIPPRNNSNKKIKFGYPKPWD